jgi:phosphatidylglycerol---prolipoprotein diacylglyceryl transferase
VRPILFEIHGFEVPAYGITMVVLFIAGLLVLWQQVRTFGVHNQQMLDLAAIAAGTILLWAGVGTLLARLQIAGPPYLNALPILAIGGFAYLAYMRRKGLPAERIFDTIAPIVAFALASQYGIGTWLAGTVFGKPTDLPWGVSFPPGSPAHRVYGPLSLHPVQLYLGTLFLLVAITARLAPVTLRAGQRALLTFIAIAVIYLLISPLRGNTTSFLAGGSPRMSEFVAVFVLLYCSIIAWRRRRAADGRP